MERAGREQAVAYSITAGRNCSLSSSGRVLVFGVLFCVSLGISTGFALVGAWPVMPFAGLEMLVLYWAFRCVGRHAGDFDRIILCGDRLTVEKAQLDEVRRYEFNRYWAQVVLRADAEGRRCRLTLRSHGREVEFGAFLTDSERMALAHQLRKELGRF